MPEAQRLIACPCVRICRKQASASEPVRFLSRRSETLASTPAKHTMRMGLHLQAFFKSARACCDEIADADTQKNKNYGCSFFAFFFGRFDFLFNLLLKLF